MPPRPLATPSASAALAMAVVLLAACGSSSPTSTNNSNTTPPPAAQGNDINIAVGAQTKGSSAFSPNPKTVALDGGTSVQVRFVNRDVGEGGYYGDGTAVVHHIVSDPGSTNPFDVGSLAGNESGTATFTAAGTYTYHCANHPTMVGTIQVDP